MKPLNFVNSFDPYSARLEESQRRRRRCIIASTVAGLLVLILIVGLAVGLAAKSHKSKKGGSSGPAEVLGSKSLATVCNKTAFPQSCISSLSPYPEAAKADPKQLVAIAMKGAVDQVKESLALVHNVSQQIEGQPNLNLRVIDALEDCSDLMLNTMDHLDDSSSEFNSISMKSLRVYSLSDIHTWLSSALTFYTTCFDGLDDAGGSPNPDLQFKGDYVQQVLTNTLSFFVAFKSALGTIPGVPTRRRLLLEAPYFPSNNHFPDWLPARRLLQMDPNVVVAKDGSGQFISIQEAVDAAPLKSKTMHVIYIKQGIYEETVIVPKATTNLAFIGDGIDKTVVRGQKSVVGGSTTFNSATVAINGKGFIASHLTITNTAGPKGHQAVALRVSADQAAFYRCSFNGYQDTLYAHSNRQFYRECLVSGTVDFIFGNAAAVFQRCDVVARLPDPNQRIMVTAHGRVTDLQNTGFSFQECRIDGVGDLVARIPEFPAFLGRPWKNYSRTVFLQSHIGRIIYPAGWSEWNGAPPARYKTVFYGEYGNVGPGAALAGRVNWSMTLTPDQAKQYTVGNLITGLEWLPKTGIVFTSDM